MVFSISGSFRRFFALCLMTEKDTNLYHEHMEKIVNKERLLIVLGMTFFWAMFRHPTIMQRMFPVGKTLPLAGIDVSLFAVFLGMLFILGVVAFFFADKLEPFFSEKKIVVLGCSVLGSLGIIANFSEQQGPGFAFWFSTVAFVLGFLALYLSWASYFTRRFSLETIFVLAVSYFISLVLFSAISPNIPTLHLFLIEIIPFACGLCFYLLPTLEGSEQAMRPAREIPKHKLAYVILFIAFLLTGSLTRGIVDALNDFSPLALLYNVRWIISLFIALTMCGICGLRYVKFTKQVDAGEDICEGFNIQKYESVEGERTTLLCWIALMVFFFAGMAVIVLGQTYSLGGHIVVAARSGLDFLLWILLCSIASSERVRTTRMFLLCGILTEIASWVISYLLIPRQLFANADSFATASGQSVLFSLFFLLAVLTLTFGALSILKENAAISELSMKTPEEEQGISPAIIAQYKLSKREAEVAWLFAQGYSLSKVASTLFISIGTAQSHIKNVYRKLGVHNKDELIELIK